MMRNNHLFSWLFFLFTFSLLMLSLIEGKGFSGGRGGGGFKGGSKGSGSFGGSSGYSRVNTNVGRPQSGSSFKSNAMSFAAGAAGGVAAYSIMRSMSGSYGHRRDGYYGPGYGIGETCTNKEDLNGTVFGTFRCPLYGFPYEAKHCCGEPGKQYCCQREQRSRFSRGASHFGWIVLVIVILLVCILLWTRRNRQRQKELMMIPTEPPPNEQYRAPPFYQPPPPAAGYPPPPMHQNPFAFSQQNQPGNFNPYAQQHQMPYPPQQPHMPYPPQQQPYNPY